MAGLLIKDLPGDLHRKLKTRAAANRRSLSAEAMTILESALDDRAGPPPLEDIDRMRLKGARPLTQAILDRARRDRR
jgi:plasmid stability protein